MKIRSRQECQVIDVCLIFGGLLAIVLMTIAIWAVTQDHHTHHKFTNRVLDPITMRDMQDSK
jgi:hypothetical protein